MVVFAYFPLKIYIIMLESKLDLLFYWENNARSKCYSLRIRTD